MGNTFRELYKTNLLTGYAYNPMKLNKVVIRKLSKELTIDFPK